MTKPLNLEVEQDVFNTDLSTRTGELYDDDGKPQRTGTLWTAATHIITATIGSGVLSLSWGLAQLGWIAGVSILLIFSAITFYTSSILADCYRSPNRSAQKRNYTYMEAVNSYLGTRMRTVCGVVQYACLFGLGVGYTITTSMSIVFSNNPYMIGLGIAEFFLSQIPNFDKLSWLSTIAATMSFGYSLIGTGLSFAKVVSGNGGKTTLSGIETGPDLSASEKMWTMFRALGDMAFACNYSAILIEIQDTLRSSPPENKVMRKANRLAMFTTTSFYLLCGCMGYAAFGIHTPGNLLTSFGSTGPMWLVDMANIFIVVHLVGAYQVLSQPVFKAAESCLLNKWPTSNLIRAEYIVRIGKNSQFRLNFLRLVFRTLYVAVVTVSAMAFPFFNDILALLGALGYWPLTVYFPVAMHLAQNNIKKNTVRWFSLQLLSLVCLVASIAAACGAIQGIHKGLTISKPFQFKQ